MKMFRLYGMLSEASVDALEVSEFAPTQEDCNEIHALEVGEEYLDADGDTWVREQ